MPSRWGNRRANEKPEIFYWLREGRTSNAEIDFVVQLGAENVPIEVKAGKSGTLKSLHRFIWEKGLKKAIRFDLNPPSIMKVLHKVTYDRESSDIDFDLLSLPLYMVEQVSRLFPTIQ